MPEFSVDFSEAVDFSEVLPVDWYHIRCRESKLGQSQAGNPKVSLQMEIIEGAYEGRRLFDDLVLRGTGAGRTKNAMRAFWGDARADASTEDFIDCEAMVRLIQRVWAEEDGGDGQLRNRITTYKAIAGLDDFVADEQMSLPLG